MEILKQYQFEQFELRSILHYQLIVECIGSDRWQTGTNKRRLNEHFTNNELTNIQKIYRRAYRWYTKELPKNIIIDEKEYLLWMKLKQYCIKFFTLYGREHK